MYLPRTYTITPLVLNSSNRPSITAREDAYYSIASVHQYITPSYYRLQKAARVDFWLERTFLSIRFVRSGL